MKLPWPFNRKQADFAHAGGTGQLQFLTNTGIGIANRGEYDYRRKVGVGTGSSVVMAPIQWIQRSLPEAPLKIERQAGTGDEWESIEHPLADLLDEPNPFYSGLHLWQATVFSYLTGGNAYWLTVPNGLGRPVELWYAPHWLITPQAPQDGSEFITGYKYRSAGREIILPPERVVHFRHGINPQNPRLGISPIDSALREIWSDMERLLKREVELLVLNRVSSSVAASAIRGIRLAINDWGLYLDFMEVITDEAEGFMDYIINDYTKRAAI